MPQLLILLPFILCALFVVHQLYHMFRSNISKPVKPFKHTKDSLKYQELLDLCERFYNQVVSDIYLTNKLRFTTEESEAHSHYIKASNLFDIRNVSQHFIKNISFIELYQYHRDYNYSLILGGKVYATNLFPATQLLKHQGVSPQLIDPDDINYRYIQFSEIDFKLLYKILYDTQKKIIPELVAQDRDAKIADILN